MGFGRRENRQDSLEEDVIRRVDVGRPSQEQHLRVAEAEERAGHTAEETVERDHAEYDADEERNAAPRRKKLF